MKRVGVAKEQEEKNQKIDDNNKQDPFSPPFLRTYHMWWLRLFMPVPSNGASGSSHKFVVAASNVLAK